MAQNKNIETIKENIKKARCHGMLAFIFCFMLICVLMSGIAALCIWKTAEDRLNHEAAEISRMLKESQQAAPQQKQAISDETQKTEVSRESLLFGSTSRNTPSTEESTGLDEAFIWAYLNQHRIFKKGGIIAADSLHDIKAGNLSQDCLTIEDAGIDINKYTAGKLSRTDIFHVPCVFTFVQWESGVVIAWLPAEEIFSALKMMAAAVCAAELIVFLLLFARLKKANSRAAVGKEEAGTVAGETEEASVSEEPQNAPVSAEPAPEETQDSSVSAEPAPIPEEMQVAPVEEESASAPSPEETQETPVSVEPAPAPTSEETPVSEELVPAPAPTPEETPDSPVPEEPSPSDTLPVSEESAPVPEDTQDSPLSKDSTPHQEPPADYDRSWINLDSAVEKAGSYEKWLEKAFAFRRSIENQAGFISDALEEDRLLEYITVSAQLKQDALEIGAEKLSQMAECLEKYGSAIKPGSKDASKYKEVLVSKTPVMLRLYRSYNQLLAPFFNDQSSGS